MYAYFEQIMTSYMECPETFKRDFAGLGRTIFEANLNENHQKSMTWWKILKKIAPEMVVVDTKWAPLTYKIACESLCALLNRVVICQNYHSHVGKILAVFRWNSKNDTSGLNLQIEPQKRVFVVLRRATRRWNCLGPFYRFINTIRMCTHQAHSLHTSGTQKK